MDIRYPRNLLFFYDEYCVFMYVYQLPYHHKTSCDAYFGTIDCIWDCTNKTNIQSLASVPKLRWTWHGNITMRQNSIEEALECALLACEILRKKMTTNDYSANVRIQFFQSTTVTTTPKCGWHADVAGCAITGSATRPIIRTTWRPSVSASRITATVQTEWTLLSWLACSSFSPPFCISIAKSTSIRFTFP